MSRELTPPPALAGIDLAAHRERAKRALVLHLGAKNMSSPPAEWEAMAEALLVLLERYGVVPLWVFDPALGARPFDRTAKQAIDKLIEAVCVSAPELQRIQSAARRFGKSQLHRDLEQRARDSEGFAYFMPHDVGGCE